MDSNLASKMACCSSIMLAFAALALRWMFCCAMMFCAVNVLVCYRHIDPFWAKFLFILRQPGSTSKTDGRTQPLNVDTYPQRKPSQ